MTDQTTTESTTESTSDGPAELRANFDRVSDENKTLKAQLKNQAIQLAGFDPSAESGPGKLLADNYAGEPTADAVKAWAEQYGIQAPKAPDAPADPPSQPVTDPAAQQNLADAAQLQKATDKADAIDEAHQPGDGEDVPDLVKAYQSGDQEAINAAEMAKLKNWPGL